jgi:transglutaminase-like putative cysteine protease
MTILNVRHTTVYRYRRPVRLGDHRLMLRPRDSHDLRLIRTNLNFLPGASVRWIHDVFGNSIAIASFAESAAELRIESKLQLETYMAERPRSEIAPEAASYPFIYSADDRIDLSRMLERHHTDPASRGPHEGHPSTTCAHSHRLLAERGVGTTSASGVIPFRNLNRSLPVERTRVVFSAMMDL